MDLYDTRTSYEECTAGAKWEYGSLKVEHHKDAIVKFTRPVRKDSTNTGVEAAFRSMFTDYGDNRVAVSCERPEWEAKTIVIDFIPQLYPTTEDAWQKCKVDSDKITIAFAKAHISAHDEKTCSDTLECQNYLCHVLYAAFATYKHETECAIVIESSKLQTNWKIFLDQVRKNFDDDEDPDEELAWMDPKAPRASGSGSGSGSGSTSSKGYTPKDTHAPIKLLHIQAAVACIQVAQIPYGTEIPEPCEPLCVCYQVESISPGFSARFCFREFYRLLGNLEADGDVESYSVCDIVRRIVLMRLQLGTITTKLHASVTLSNLTKVLRENETDASMQCHIPFAILHHHGCDGLPPFASTHTPGSLHVFSGHYTYE